MSLSLGLRDEENERINNILNKLMELAYVPEGWLKDEAQPLLTQLGLSYESLAAMTGDELNAHITKLHFDFANMERLADILAANPTFKDKAIALYNFTQVESKMFSFDIFNKINALK
ncbi:hypothetical protein [Flavobacterium sp. AG291]|uniref:hypothetical protein n=1 Tax=Flavobacterium sp. AG291 TaxID=2184000 RepID=UPI000E0B733C|nr:hypothetical protein [Flavobacterium sp. AG291]RDI08484.1 hypothetical protein DEU42_11015 [Flavobacterium sp. AG291]